MAKKNQVARNERERKRVHQVNHGFDVLRNRLQPKNHTKKWSKADTLREAVKYIQQLQVLLNSDPQQASVSSTTCDYTTNSTPTCTTTSNYTTNYNVKEEFSMYMGQQYQVPPPQQSFSTSPTSSVSSSSFSPSQYNQHHYNPYVQH